jgi:hypothetical protein
VLPQVGDRDQEAGGSVQALQSERRCEDERGRKTAVGSRHSSASIEMKDRFLTQSKEATDAAFRLVAAALDSADLKAGGQDATID